MTIIKTIAKKIINTFFRFILDVKSFSLFKIPEGDVELIKLLNAIYMYIENKLVNAFKRNIKNIKNT